MSDQKGWEETAKYWTECYANGSESARPPEAGSAGAGAARKATGEEGDVEEAAAKAGLKVEHVQQFSAMVSGASQRTCQAWREAD